MSDLFLIASPNSSPTGLLRSFDLITANTPVAAVLLPREGLADNAYKTQCKALIPRLQAAGAAVLIEGEPGLVKLLGADGLHVTGGVKAVDEAIKALKPNHIVGIGDSRSRHDAMQKGELGIDYVMFGPLAGPLDAETREMAAWWAETMEIPAVLSDPEARIDAHDAAGCEFIALPLEAIEAGA